MKVGGKRHYTILGVRNGEHPCDPARAERFLELLNRLEQARDEQLRREIRQQRMALKLGQQYMSAKLEDGAWWLLSDSFEVWQAAFDLLSKLNLVDAHGRLAPQLIQFLRPGTAKEIQFTYEMARDYFRFKSGTLKTPYPIQPRLAGMDRSA